MEANVGHWYYGSGSKNNAEEHQALNSFPYMLIPISIKCSNTMENKIVNTTLEKSVF